MKRRLCIALLTALMVLLLCACGEDKGKIQKDFLQMMDQKATPQHLVEVRAYLDDNLPKSDKELAEQMVMRYEDYLLQYINVDAEEGLASLLSAYYDGETETVDPERIQESDIRELCESLLQAGVRFSMKGDQLTLSVNYQEFLERYGERIAPGLAGLYALKEQEFDKPVADNAVLKISWKELADRAYSVEQLIEENKEDALIHEDAKWMYENYLGFMLMGMNNTPIFDFNSTDFSVEADAAYTAFRAEHPGTNTAWVLGEFDEYLQSVNYQMNYSDKVQSKEFFDQCSRLVSEAGKRVYE